MRNDKVVGYVASSRRYPDGRYFRTLEEAKKEARRQLKYCSESGVREVYQKEWDDNVK